MAVSPEHSLKVELPISVTEFPIVIDFRAMLLLLFLKGDGNTPEKIERLRPKYKVSSGQSENKPSNELKFKPNDRGSVPSSSVSSFIPKQPSKAPLSIEVTEFGMVIEVSPEQPEKAEPPIEVTE